jgi:hypothetical protein
VHRAEKFGSYNPGNIWPLGNTSLLELDLDGPIYEAPTDKDGCFTVEHLVDLRERGSYVSGIGPKRLARLDAILVERGLLSAEAGCVRLCRSLTSQFYAAKLDEPLCCFSSAA